MCMKMLSLPVDIICGGILPCLSVCDLQALDTAFTNKCLRPQLRQVWKSYQYDAFGAVLTEYDFGWLCGIGVQIISLTLEVHGSNFRAANISTLKNLRLNKKISDSLETFLYFFVDPQYSPIIKSDVLLNLAENCPNLEELRVSHLLGSNTDNAVSALAQNCRQLHTLHLGSEDLTDAGISALAQYCAQLHTLYIGNATITDAGIQTLCDNCPHLKQIRLPGCYNLTDDSLIAIADSYPHLQSINVDSNNFTNDGLIYFADKCHELQSVSVRSENITSSGLTVLWDANPNLMDFDFNRNYLFDDDIFELPQCCPLLQKLILHQCCEVTDAAVIAVAENCAQLRSFVSHGQDLSDDSLIALGQHCHELKSINVSHLHFISDVGIAALAAGCPLLQEFAAYYSNIADAGVVALARGCRDLRSIMLNRCKRIGIIAITAIAENCPLISELELSSCPKVDDACLYIIAQHCRNLTYLDITDSNELSVAAVISVIKSCRMLRKIDCRKCFKKGAELQLTKLVKRVNVSV